MVLIPHLVNDGWDQVNASSVKARRISYFHVQNMHFMGSILSNSFKNDRTMRRKSKEGKKRAKNRSGGRAIMQVFTVIIQKQGRGVLS
jgi:hypothetical protein